MNIPPAYDQERSDRYRPRFSLLDEAGCRRIHQATLQILAQTGVRIYHQSALGLLRQAGAHISDDNLVRLPPELVEWALGKAPDRISLHSRGGGQPDSSASGRATVDLSGQHVNFGPGSDCLNYLDPKEGRRKFTTQDVAACVRLCDALPQIAFVMSMGIPVDVFTEQQYRQQFALMLANTTKPAVFVAHDRADCQAIVAMAATAAGGLESLRERPTLLLYSEPTTPLSHSETATDKLLFMAEQRLPIVHSPAPMMGGTAPITLGGGMALGNAEVLSSLVMHQLQQQGAPFVYGSGLHHLDMRTTISVYGAPEFQLARAMVTEMGRFYRLPTWGYAGCTDSLVMDGQAAADTAYQVRDALLLGTNLVHDVGYMEGGLTTSPELIVFTAEMIEMHRHFLEGISLDEDAMALELIHEIGPGGHYMATEHTLAHFRDYWYPTLFERRQFDLWQADGSRDLAHRLREKTVAIMEAHQPEPLPERVRDEVEAILAEGQY